MVTKLDWGKSGLSITFPVAAQPAPRVQQAYPIPDIPIQSVVQLAVALETVAQTGRTGIRVTSLALFSGTAGAVFSIIHTAVQDVTTAMEELPLTGRTANILLDQPLPDALHSFALKRVDAGQTVTWPAVVVTTPVDPTQGTIIDLVDLNTDVADDWKITDQERPEGRRWLAAAKARWEAVYSLAVAAGMTTQANAMRDSVWKPVYAYFAPIFFQIPGFVDYFNTGYNGTQTYDSFGSVIVTPGAFATGTFTFTNAGTGTQKWDKRGIWDTFYNGLQNASINLQATVAARPAASGLAGVVKPGAGVDIALDGTISASVYTLPVASASVLGGVKQGTNITIAGDGTISATGTFGSAFSVITGQPTDNANLAAALAGKVGTFDSRLTDSRPASDVWGWAKASVKPAYTYLEVGAVSSSDSRLSDARPASDVWGWAKTSVKPSYSFGEIGLGPILATTVTASGQVVGTGFKGTGAGVHVFLDAGSASGATYINYNTGTGGAIFCNGASAPVASISNTGVYSGSSGLFSGDLLTGAKLGWAYTQGAIRTLWGGAFGGVVQIKADAATANRWGRIGITDSVGDWQGGLTIANDLSAAFDAGISATTATIGGVSLPGSNRINGASNLVINASGSSPLYLNWDSGSGGTIFGNGAGGQAGAMTAGGAFTAATANFGGGANPGYSLYVNGPLGARGDRAYFGNLTNDRRLQLSNDGTSSIINSTYGSAGGSPMLFMVSDVEVMRFAASGGAATFSAGITATTGTFSGMLGVSSTIGAYGQFRVNNTANNECSMSFSNNNSGIGSAGSSPGGNVWGLGLGTGGINPDFGLFNGLLGANAIRVSQANNAVTFAAGISATTGTFSSTGTFGDRVSAPCYVIVDRRNTNLAPNAYPDNGMSLQFNQALGVPGGCWASAITMRGWNSNYSTWQMAGAADTTTSKRWFLRDGVGTSWNDWCEIYHTGNMATSLQAMLAQTSLQGAPVACTVATKPAVGSLTTGAYIYVLDDNAWNVSQGNGMTTGGTVYQATGTAGQPATGWSAAKLGTLPLGVLSAAAVGATALASEIAMTTVIRSTLYTAGGRTNPPAGFKLSGPTFLSTCLDDINTGALRQFQANMELGAGVNLGGYELGQLAVAKLANGGTWALSAAGTYTWVCPKGITEITVSVVGAGGGGGCGGSGNGVNAGGGGGTAEAVIQVTYGTAYTITVGAGGAAAVYGITAGDGGNTSITGGGVSLTAVGGTRGTLNGNGGKSTAGYDDHTTGATATTAAGNAITKPVFANPSTGVFLKKICPGSAGGSLSVTYAYAQGGSADGGLMPGGLPSLTSGGAYSGGGGSSSMGAGGAGSTASAPGGTGQGPGAGGGSGWSGQAAGRGADGYCKINW
jgi:hypothetical protein